MFGLAVRFSNELMKPLLAVALGAFLFCSAADNGGDDSLLWISSTGKTHNSSCRYYGMGKGRFTRQGSGNNCKFCGGDKPLMPLSPP